MSTKSVFFLFLQFLFEGLQHYSHSLGCALHINIWFGIHNIYHLAFRICLLIIYVSAAFVRRFRKISKKTKSNFVSSVCLSFRLTVSLSVRLSVRLHVRLSVRLSVCPSVCPSVFPCVRPSVCPSVCPPVRPSVLPSVCPSIRLPAPPSVRLPVRPSVCFLPNKMLFISQIYPTYESDRCTVHFVKSLQILTNKCTYITFT